MDLSPKKYVVREITGDYALLRRIDIPAQSDNQVALALLPEDLNPGDKLRWESFTYTKEQNG